MTKDIVKGSKEVCEGGEMRVSKKDVLMSLVAATNAGPKALLGEAIFWVTV